MSILSQLASASGNRSEIPNQELAARIVQAENKDAVKVLVENLENKKKDIQSDCIKTLYEIAEKKPEIVSGYTSDLIKLLDSKHQRMVWGGMTALSAIASDYSLEIYQALPKIMDVADKSGSVIARDHAMYILAKLAGNDAWYEDCYALIAEQLLKAPVNQFPMYVEITVPVIQDKDKAAFKMLLVERLKGIEQESKRKRIEKALKKLG